MKSKLMVAMLLVMILGCQVMAFAEATADVSAVAEDATNTVESTTDAVTDDAATTPADELVAPDEASTNATGTTDAQGFRV